MLLVLPFEGDLKAQRHRIQNGNAIGVIFEIDKRAEAQRHNQDKTFG